MSATMFEVRLGDDDDYGAVPREHYKELARVCNSMGRPIRTSTLPRTRSRPTVKRLWMLGPSVNHPSRWEEVQ